MALNPPSQETNLSQGETVRTHILHGGWCEAPARSAVGTLFLGVGGWGSWRLGRPCVIFLGTSGEKKIRNFRRTTVFVEKNDAKPVP